MEALEVPPLPWVLRDALDPTGTKFGCGMGLCGVCMVHVDGEPARSCQLTISRLGDRAVTTIEGSVPEGESHSLQRGSLR